MKELESVGAVSEQSAGSDYNTGLHFPHRTGQKRKHSHITVRGRVADRHIRCDRHKNRRFLVGFVNNFLSIRLLVNLLRVI